MKLQIDVRYQMVPEYRWLAPVQQSDGASGLDLRAAIADDIVILMGERQLIPTGLRVAIPEGYEAQIRPRSGLAIKHGITVLNSPGTIDSDFRGEIGVILINCGTEPFRVQPGNRISQLVFAPVAWPRMIEGGLDQTNRGEGGFGSTGI